MQFEQTLYKDGKPIVTTVKHPSVEAVRSMLNERWNKEVGVYAIEETNYENGKVGFSLKDKHHKVIIQIKEKDTDAPA